MDAPLSLWLFKIPLNFRPRSSDLSFSRAKSGVSQLSESAKLSASGRHDPFLQHLLQNTHWRDAAWLMEPLVFCVERACQQGSSLSSAKLSIRDECEKTLKDKELSKQAELQKLMKKKQRSRLESEQRGIKKREGCWALRGKPRIYMSLGLFASGNGGQRADPRFIEHGSLIRVAEEILSLVSSSPKSTNSIIICIRFRMKFQCRIFFFRPHWFSRFWGGLLILKFDGEWTKSHLHSTAMALSARRIDRTWLLRSLHFCNTYVKAETQWGKDRDSETSDWCSVPQMFNSPENRYSNQTCRRVYS